MTTTEKCEAILRNIMERGDKECRGAGNFMDPVIMLGPDGTGAAFTVWLNQTHYHIRGENFEHLVAKLLKLLEETPYERVIPIPSSKRVEWEPMPDYGEYYTLDGFQQAVNSGMFTDDDGHGYYAMAWAQDGKPSRMSNVGVDLSGVNVPGWATHVVWFNK
jgi:hypothetical protein